jgi:adenylosuccinate lyase
MRRNLELTGGLFFSEAVLLALVRKGMARQAAYELVQRNALRAAAQLGGAPAGAADQSFRALLGGDPDVAARLTPAEIDQAFDLGHHLRHTGTIIDRALRDEEVAPS